MDNLLDVKDLSVSFGHGEDALRAVRGVSFSLKRGLTLGLVGESGCGKSVTASSLLRLVSPPGRITGGQIGFQGRDILSLSDENMRRIRGKEMAMIFQEPMISLNPVFTVGYQITEVLKLHENMNDSDAREKAVELMDQVGIPSPEARYRSYPHEFSGGMRQRIMIAIALAGSPQLLIADEPTTALDVTIQAQILDLLLSIQEQRGMALLLISHNLGLVFNAADYIAIMYAGQIVEYGTSKSIYRKPLHPYTKGLFMAIPRLGERSRTLYTIPGNVPFIREELRGCAFAPRCPLADDECLGSEIKLHDAGKEHTVRCIHWKKVGSVK